jgi:hypothetical protein
VGIERWYWVFREWEEAMGQECSICSGPPERLEETNQLLADNFEYKRIAGITGASKSAVGRHAMEEETKRIIAILRSGATPDEASSLTAWTENLRMAREKGDSVSAIRAQRELDKIRGRIGERKESAKAPKGPSNVHPSKETWKLCKQCLWLEMLGHNKLPDCSTEAYRIELAGKAMPWLTSESNQPKPRHDLIAAAGYLSAGLLQSEWPPEYAEAVAKFKAALEGFTAAREFAIAVRRIEDELQRKVQDV